MKILVISPVPIFPAMAGNRVRILNMLKVLRSQGHEIHFCCLDTLSTAGEPTDRKAHDAWFGSERVSWVSQRASLPLLAAYGRKAVRKLLRKTGLEAASLHGLDEWFMPDFESAIKNLHLKHRFDAVLVEYVFLSRAFLYFDTNVRKILDAHDTFGDRHLHFLKNGLIPSWYSTSLSEEERGFHRADKVLAIQENEAHKFQERMGSDFAKIVTVSHLLPDLSEALSVPPGKIAAYMASAGPTNVQAIKYLMEEVVPLVLRRHSDFRLHVAGPICAKIPDTDYLTKMGFIEEPAELFAVSALMVNPTLLGTGLNIKVLDALSHGVPVVSTQTGARGFDTTSRKGIIAVEDNDPAEFANAICSLFESDPSIIRLEAITRAHDWHANHSSALTAVFEPVNA